VIGILAPACNGNDSPEDPRFFELDGEEVDEGELPPTHELSEDWGKVLAVVVEAPAVVTAGEELDVVIELRNPTDAVLSLTPCPTWVAWFGDNGPTTRGGNLPCNEINSFDAGERIRFGMTIGSPPRVACHDGYDAEFSWQLLDGPESDRRATVGIPMRASRSAEPNNCGGPTTAPPPDLERT